MEESKLWPHLELVKKIRSKGLFYLLFFSLPLIIIFYLQILYRIVHA